jgi:hypothetical protein
VSLQYSRMLMDVICSAVFHLPRALTFTACGCGCQRWGARGWAVGAGVGRA